MPDSLPGSLLEPLQGAGKVDDGQVVASGLLTAGRNAPKRLQCVEEDRDKMTMTVRLLVTRGTAGLHQPQHGIDEIVVASRREAPMTWQQGLDPAPLLIGQVVRVNRHQVTRQVFEQEQARRAGWRGRL